MTPIQTPEPTPSSSPRPTSIPTSSPGRDRAWGCMLGALAGEAAGAVLEFYGGKITSDVVDAAMTLPGGGCFRVGPGQITDDGELAMCLAHALCEVDPAMQVLPAQVSKDTDVNSPL